MISDPPNKHISQPSVPTISSQHPSIPIARLQVEELHIDTILAMRLCVNLRLLGATSPWGKLCAGKIIKFQLLFMTGTAPKTYGYPFSIFKYVCRHLALSALSQKKNAYTMFPLILFSRLSSERIMNLYSLHNYCCKWWLFANSIKTQNKQ